MSNYHHYSYSGTLNTDAGKQAFDSLTDDMAALRKKGAALKIVDPAVADIGTTSGGSKILALKIGRNPACRLLFVGCHHAREWISVEVPYHIGKYLIDNYKERAAAKTPKEIMINHLVDNAEIWIVPMLNPDGHKKTMSLGNGFWRTNIQKSVYPVNTPLDREVETKPYQTGIYSTGADKYDYKCYRVVQSAVPGKTRTQSEVIPAGTYIGVDLNRNYPVPPGGPKSKSLPWGIETFDPTKYSDSFGGGFVEFYAKSGPTKGMLATFVTNLTTSKHPNPPDTYCGLSGGSALEVQAITKLLGKGAFKSVVSYHNSSQMLLYPDDAALDKPTQFLGKGMRDLFKDQKHPYAYVSGSQFYPTSGDSMEWMWRVHAVTNYTVELSPTAADAKKNDWDFNKFPASKIDETFKHNLPSALCNINCAIAGMAPPVAPGAKSGKVAKVGPNCWEVFKGWVP